MMQFTEEQRKALIKKLESWVSVPFPGHSDDVRAAFKIALAALKAKPVAYVHPSYLQPGALGFDASTARLAPAQVELYTAPPVAALRLPDVITLTEASKHTGGLSFAETVAFADGANWRLEEVKRLNTTAPEEKPE